MKRIVFMYGIALALAVALLKFLEYQFLVRDLSIEVYIAIIGVLFMLLGVWVGWKITRKKKLIVPFPATGDFQPNSEVLEATAISKREYEVLELMAHGLSNHEIAQKLFVTVSTVKTHAASLFIKLDAKRRTQAIQKAKILGLLP